MDSSLKTRLCNQIFKVEVGVQSAGEDDASFTLDYEDGRYRQNELVGIIRDAVPFFALTEDEISTIDKSEWNKNSFTRISDANRKSKGDYGELLLFLILSVFYDVPKFVTKARLRSTTREQIKGFDCAHFSISDSKVTLWLGEAKFHQSISSAITSALKSLQEHLNDSGRIKSELRLLGGEIEINKQLEEEKYELLKSYVAGGRSLDKVDIAVPVLCTYDSKCIKNFSGKMDSDIESDDFKDKMSVELEENFKNIYSKDWPKRKNIKIVFFIVPLESVSELKKSIELVENAMKF
ncbi:HamA C-terminal domain-containing protein [Halomonas sp. E14]|uniref:HamA C-terminal domain-containing protein n=1 Tax=Halomonas sp. E14 TaxID=3397245 RepID=UPI00403ED1FD